MVPRLARVINVTQLPDGYFSLTIDGFAVPWTVEQIQTQMAPGDGCPYVTVRIPADRVELINQTYD